MEGRRTKETTAGSVSMPTGVKIGGPFKVQENPAFLQERAKLFDEIYQRQKKQLESLNKREIDITLPDGKVFKGTCWETTPLDIAKKISKNLADACVAAKVLYSKKDDNGFNQNLADVEREEDSAPGDKSELYDLTRPFEGDCNLQLLKFDDPEGRSVFWHSSAHILGGALEQEYGCHLCIGPPLENGFYYDAYLGDNRISPEQFEKIEKRIKKFAEENHSFQKVYLTKKEALELFKDNPFKTQLITYKIPENAITTAYKSGSLIDLCTGPHLPSTAKAKAFKVTKTSAAYWLGKNTNDDLQRVYGVSFPSDKQLKEYIALQEEIEKRDHRNIGTAQELFFFNQMSPGSAFFYPPGAVIYNRLVELIRREYLFRGYSEVITPNMYNVHLWQTSGHWAKYRTNMFTFSVEEQDFALKPMNCPGHCLMFDSVLRSYKELPIRFADFGVLHRNELSGALSGLTRVRRFQQDDAHIFCTVEQIQEEILGVLDFLQYVYGLLGFEFKYDLSTRPAEALGEKELWDKAEAALAEALNKSGKPWKENPGDGAFYGPKIDIKVCDALKREHQLGTIQLDFNLPIRFNLQYRTAENEEPEPEEVSEEEKAKLEAAKKEAQAKKKAEKEAQRLAEKAEKKAKQKEAKEARAKEAKGEAPATTEGDKPAETKPQEKVEAKVEAKVEPQGSPFKQEETKYEDLKQDEGHTCHTHHTHGPVEGHLKTGFQRPVMIHRAVLGSVERMIAILCEHTGGKWPFWLSPRQVKIIPISEKFMSYAESIYERLRLEGYAVELDRTNFTINKKVRNAQISQFNYIAVVGEEEAKAGAVDLRERDNKDRLGKYTIPDLLKLFDSLKPTPSKPALTLKERAFFNRNGEVSADQLDSLNKDLLLKVYFDGTTEPGQQDKEYYEKLKDVEIDADKYPHLFRWKNFVASQLKK